MLFRLQWQTYFNVSLPKKRISFFQPLLGVCEEVWTTKNLLQLFKEVDWTVYQSDWRNKLRFFNSFWLQVRLVLFLRFFYVFLFLYEVNVDKKKFGSSFFFSIYFFFFYGHTTNFFLSSISAVSKWLATEAEEDKKKFC